MCGPKMRFKNVGKPKASALDLLRAATPASVPKRIVKKVKAPTPEAYDPVFDVASAAPAGWRDARPAAARPLPVSRPIAAPPGASDEKAKLLAQLMSRAPPAKSIGGGAGGVPPPHAGSQPSQSHAGPATGREPPAPWTNPMANSTPPSFGTYDARDAGRRGPPPRDYRGGSSSSSYGAGASSYGASSYGASSYGGGSGSSYGGSRDDRGSSYGGSRNYDYNY